MMSHVVAAMNGRASPRAHGRCVVLFIAPAQYWLGVTRTRLALHRVLGRLYLIAVAVSSAASVGLAILNDIS